MQDANSIASADPGADASAPSSSLAPQAAGPPSSSLVVADDTTAAAATTAAAPVSPPAALAAPVSSSFSPAQQSPLKRPTSTSTWGGGARGGGGGPLVDALRSIGQLTLCNAPAVQEELRGLVASASAVAAGASGRGGAGGGGRRGKGGAEEAVGVLAELASLASCINELVASAVGAMGAGEQGAEAAAAAAAGAEGAVGGGAVAVGGRLVAAAGEEEGGGLHLHSSTAPSSSSSLASFSPPLQLHHLQQVLQQHAQQQQASAHPGSMAAVVAADEDDSPQPHPHQHQHLQQPPLLKSPRPSPVLAVLGDAALLHYVLDFVAAPCMAHRRQLGVLALVSRQWRELAHSERFWRPIVLQLFPRLSPSAADHDEDEAATGAAASTPTSAAGQQGQMAGTAGTAEASAAPGSGERCCNYRKYLVQYGRCLVEHPVRQGPWHEGITLSFDLHDEQDGARLFSSTGPIRFTGTTIPGITAMKLTGRRRRVTRPFSAAGRDPSGHLASIEELITEGDSQEYPVALTIRVTARDERTGRMALLFSSSKRTKRWVEPLGEDMGVPQGTLLVNQGWARVTIPGTDLAMQMLTVFYVAPVEQAQGPAQPQPPLQQLQLQQAAGQPQPQQHGGGGGGGGGQQQQQQQQQDAPPQGQQQQGPPPAGGMAVAGAGGAVGAGAGGGGGGGAGQGNGGAGQGNAGAGNGNPTDPAHRQYAVLTLDCAFMLQCKTECTESIGRFIIAALENGPPERIDD